MEIPVHNNAVVTSRSLQKEHPSNADLYRSSQEFQDLLKEVKIRFDTNPKFYQKEDYQKLIELIRKKSGSAELTVEISGSGNVVTDVSYKDGILTITKGNVQGGSEDVFPDYAFWQKNYIKKGGECLWVPEKITFSFPTNERRNKNIWLEIDRIHDNSYFKVSTELLRKICVGQELIQFRFGITDHTTRGDILYIHYGADLQNVAQWSMGDFGVAILPAENLLQWANESGEYITFTPEDKYEKPVLFIDYNNYFLRKPSKNKFYIIRWEDDWRFVELNKTEIKCKYHQLIAKIYNQSGGVYLSRDTWREYSEPNVEIFTKEYFGEPEYYYDEENDEWYSQERPLGQLDQLEDLLIFGIKTRRKIKITKNNDDEQDGEDDQDDNENVSLFGLGEGGIFPDFDDKESKPHLPLYYSTYQRHYHWNDATIRNRRKTFEWTSYTHGSKESNRCLSILERLFNRVQFSGTIPNTSWWHNKIGSNSGHAIIFIRIPFDYVAKGQSKSWSNRSRKSVTTKRQRTKIFFKGKIACFRIVISYYSKNKQVSISPDKIPFIMPKICY